MRREAEGKKGDKERSGGGLREGSFERTL